MYLASHLGEPTSGSQAWSADGSSVVLPSSSGCWAFNLRQAMREVVATREDVARVRARLRGEDPALIAAMAALSTSEDHPAEGEVPQPVGEV